MTVPDTLPGPIPVAISRNRKGGDSWCEIQEKNGALGLQGNMGSREGVEQD